MNGGKSVIFFKLKRKKGNSVQELMGIKSFSKYGIKTDKGELAYFLVSPTNISVLSYANIDAKINNLKLVFATYPGIEIICTDASECFDANKAYISKRIEEENNPKVNKLLKKDMAFLDRIQIEMATARQFFFAVRFKNKKDEQIFSEINDIANNISREGFEIKRMKKEDIKRLLALYFDASINGEQLPDYDGEQYLKSEAE